MDAETGTMDIVNNQTPRDRMRAADVDRERVAERLRAAHAEGRLDLTEYDERVQQAWAARTYGELETLTVDLPQPRLPAATQPRPETPHPCGRRSDEGRSVEQRGAEQRGHGRGGRAAVTAWAGASLINLMIWALVCLTTLSWIYPWWVWVAGPWGAVLLGGWIGQRARSAEPPE